MYCALLDGAHVSGRARFTAGATFPCNTYSSANLLGKPVLHWGQLQVCKERLIGRVGRDGKHLWFVIVGVIHRGFPSSSGSRTVALALSCTGGSAWTPKPRVFQICCTHASPRWCVPHLGRCYVNRSSWSWRWRCKNAVRSSPCPRQLGPLSCPADRPSGAIPARYGD